MAITKQKQTRLSDPTNSGKIDLIITIPEACAKELRDNKSCQALSFWACLGGAKFLQQGAARSCSTFGC
jgi:hypothetical protein